MNTSRLTAARSSHVTTVHVTRIDETNVISFLKQAADHKFSGAMTEEEFGSLIAGKDKELETGNSKFTGLTSNVQIVLGSAAPEYNVAYTNMLENMAYQDGAYTFDGQQVHSTSIDLTGHGRKRLKIVDGVLQVTRDSGEELDAGKHYAKNKSNPIERFFHNLLLKLLPPGGEDYIYSIYTHHRGRYHLEPRDLV